MKILAIVGCMCITDEKKAKRIIEAEILKELPDMVISGDAPGVDTWALQVATELRVKTRTFYAPGKRWGGKGGFKERNMEVAHFCTHLLRIASKYSKTYGSGWTRDYAKGLGKSTREIVFEEGFELGESHE